MVKIIIDINEDKKIETDEIIANKVNVHIEEIGVHATEKEMEVLKEFRKRLQVDNKHQVINKSKKDKEKTIEELLKNILN